MKKTIIILMLALFAVSLFVGCENEPEAKTYKVGDKGPAGGIIFYVNPNASTDGWTYLEGAIGNVIINNERTFCFGYYRKGETNTAIIVDGTTEAQDIRVIGKGKSNTDALIAKLDDSAYDGDGNHTTSNYAAKVAKSYTGGGYDDWFLPSTNEIIEMMKVPSLNVSRGSDLWSSTEYDASNAELSACTSSGDYTSKDKSEKHAVRPVRRF